MRRGSSQPQRTCIGCHVVRPKQELIRLVHTSSRTAEVDTSGKGQGRGAYLCYRLSCWERGVKGNRLERALRTKISSEDRTQLMEVGKKLYHSGFIYP